MNVYDSRVVAMKLSAATQLAWIETRWSSGEFKAAELTAYPMDDVESFCWFWKRTTSAEAAHAIVVEAR